jgi:hypothetical protein
LKVETQKKIDLVMSEKVEIKRRHDEIQWLQSFLKYQENLVTPPDYLCSWARHLARRDEILSYKEYCLLDIPADLKVEGYVTVTPAAAGPFNMRSPLTFRNKDEQPESSHHTEM